MSIKFDLCIGAGEVFLEFREVEDRDCVWDNMIKSYGWQDDWGSKLGDGSGPRCCIIINQDKIPSYRRWHCFFE